MKNLLVTLDFPPNKGGVATYLEALCNQFSSDNIEVIAQKSKNSFLFDSKQRYKITRTDLLFNLLRPRWLRSLLFIKNYLKENKIDHIFTSHILPIGLVCYLLRKPYSVIVHGMDVQLARRTPLKAFILRKILRSSKNIICNSNYTKSLIEAEIGITDKIIVSYPCPKDFGNTESKFSKEGLGAANDETLILSVARLVPRKGIDMILASIAFLVHKMQQKIKYIIIGSGYDESRLKNLIDDYSLKNNVLILKDVNDNELPSYYNACDFFILLPRAENIVDVEGFGIVFLEAAKFKKTSIAGASGGVLEAVTPETGIIVDPINIEEICGKILFLINNPDQRDYLAKNAKERVESHFQWNIQFEEIMKIYN